MLTMQDPQTVFLDEADALPFAGDGAAGEDEGLGFERRRFQRYNQRHFGKIYDWRSRRYIPCTTCNVSQGGAFVEIARPLPFERGDRVLMGLASAQRSALLRAADLFEVEIMRAMTTSDGRQGLAVRFVNADRATAEPTTLRLAA